MNESVTQWIHELRQGNHDAAQRLWERYFADLVQLAKQKLRGKKSGAADEEDVALSAFDSVCRGIGNGRFPQLLDRDNLWRLLVVITARKSAHLLRDERREKRGGHRKFLPLQMELVLDDGTELAAPELSPEFAAQVAEEYECLLAALSDDELRSIAVWKMEGFTNDEIALKLGCAPRTVERRLRLIRQTWEKRI